MLKKKALVQRRAELLAAERGQLEQLQSAELGLEGDAEEVYTSRRAEIEKLDAEIAGLERVEAEIRQRASNGRASAGAMNPWSSLGEQLSAVVRAGTPGGQVDPRLHTQLLAAGANSGIPGEGGFLVAPEFARDIWTVAAEESVLASRCRTWPLSPGANGLELPLIDSTSRQTGSRLGGVRVYRVGEGSEITASKPSFDKLQLKLEKLAALAYATSELLEDSAAMGEFLRRAFGEELAFVLDEEILSGNGVARCLGVLSSNALVTVPKEAGQAAGTVVYENVVKMWSRCWGRSRRNAVWFVSQSVESQLFTMALTVGTGGAPVFLPGGGASEQPFATLFGRPVVPIEQCSNLGTVGDIILADMSQYLLLRKEPEIAQSMHVRFIYDEQAFRLVMRAIGAPLWKSSITPANGGDSLSPFIALATRA
ncbi:MAG: phage major capsid protein [Bryobacterales bacterium]|nr:phage major capsid protein [Bryobacterales bacterium]